MYIIHFVALRRPRQPEKGEIRGQKPLNQYHNVSDACRPYAGPQNKSIIIYKSACIFMQMVVYSFSSAIKRDLTESETIFRRVRQFT